MDTDRYMCIISVIHDNIVIFYSFVIFWDKQLTKQFDFLLEQNPRIRRTGLQQSR